MPTLEELLRASLKGANEKFDQANTSLHAAVVEAAKAVEAATEGKATLRLSGATQDESGTRYSLGVLAKDAGSFRELAVFFIPQRGFPIYRETRSREIEGSFHSESALKAYFNSLATDPDSPLIGYLAYILRSTSNPPSHSPDDPIPF